MVLASALNAEVFLHLAYAFLGIWYNSKQFFKCVLKAHKHLIQKILTVHFVLQQVHMFASLLERPLIKADAAAHYSALLEMFDVELDNAKILYDNQIAAKSRDGVPPISKNMPPVAGQLKWALELQERLQNPMKDLQAIDHP